jgi:hypothetical protein
MQYHGHYLDSPRSRGTIGVFTDRLRDPSVEGYHVLSNLSTSGSEFKHNLSGMRRIKTMRNHAQPTEDPDADMPAPPEVEHDRPDKQDGERGEKDQ